MLTIMAFLATAGAVLPPPGSAPSPVRPRIEAWTNRGDALFARGDGVRLFFEADQDAYVTLLRIDTDGRVRVLFPRAPWEDNFARGGREYEAEGLGSQAAFRIDDQAGMGYIFAVVAADPFAYGAIVSADHWDYRLIADGRVRGDPYVALTELVERIVPPGYTDWDYDLIPYYVERHYDYPRFLCYDCHAYASGPSWDPYHWSCVRFRLVIYDDPWYYPYRYRHGTRVVVVRPYRPAPRFVFKDHDGGRFVTRVRERPVNDDTRRGTRGRDLGAPGAIPAPVSPRSRPDPRSDDSRRDRGSEDRDRGADVAPSGPSRAPRTDRGDPPGRRAEPGHGDDDGRQGRGAGPGQQAPPARQEPAERSGRERRAAAGQGAGERGAAERPQRSERAAAEPPPKREEPKREEPRAERREGRGAEARVAPRAEPRRDEARPPERREPDLKRRRA